MRTVDHISDDALMSAFIAGDTAAMEALFDRHRQAVFGWIRHHVSDSAEAEDMYHDVWLRIIRQAQSYRPGGFRAWMWRIVRNCTIDHARKMRPELTLDGAANVANPDGETLIDTIPDESAVHALTGMEAVERRTAVTAAIDALSPPLKEVVLLRIQGELEFREIAAQLGLPLGTVLARMHNAVEKLKRNLAGKGE